MSKKDYKHFPWYIRVITGIGAFCASLFVIAFLIVTNLIDSDNSPIVVGSIFLCGAFIVSLFSYRNPMSEPITIALALTGQILVAAWFVIKYHNDSMQGLFVTGILLEAVLYFALRSKAHQFISTVLFFLSIFGLLYEFKIMGGIQILLGSLGIASILMFYLRHGIAYYFSATLSGLLFSFLLLNLLNINEEIIRIHLRHWEISSVIIFTAIGYLVYESLAVCLGIKRWIAIAIIAGLFVILLPSSGTPGIAGGVLLLLSGFRFQSKKVMIFGILFLIVFIIGYYYSLQMLLIHKSYVLMSSGLLFLAGGFILNRLIREKATQ